MIKEGLYLEEYQSTVGTGGTSRNITYRNIWVTREIREKSAVFQLLDDKANPTGITEDLGLREIQERFKFKPIKPEAWANLQKKLSIGPGPMKAAPKVPAPQVEDKPKKEKSKNWWEAGDATNKIKPF